MFLSFGIAMPMEEAMSRFGSLVALSASTMCRIWPGSRSFTPCSRVMILHRGGKMLVTRTRLYSATPASRSAASKEASFAFARPTPFVMKSFVGTRIGTSPRRHALCGAAVAPAVATV